MTFFNQLLSTFAGQRLGWTLVHSLWQFAAIGLLLWGLLSLLQRRSANLRYLVACGALLAMLAGSTATFLILGDAAVAKPLVASAEIQPIIARDSFPPETSTTLAASPASKTPAEISKRTTTSQQASSTTTPSFSHALIEFLEPWLPWISLAWLGGVAILSLRNLGGWIGAERLRRLGNQPVAEELADRARGLITRMIISRPVRILQSALVEVPIVVGWLKPVILVPVGILGGLSPEQFDAILAHELAHIRRHDYLVNLLQTVLETLFFYHPAVWWLSRRIRIEREHCCDDAAVGVCGTGLGLGEALTLFAAARMETKPAMAASGGSLVERVRRIIVRQPEGPDRHYAWLAGAMLVGIVLACTFVLGGATTDASPQAAPDPAPDSSGARKSRNIEESQKTEKPAENSKNTEKVSQTSIAGTVTDTAGKPIAGATVEWGHIHDSPEKWQRTTTDAEGRYRLDLQSYGINFRLGVSSPGKAPQWNVFFPSWLSVGASRRGDEEAIPPEKADFKLEPAHRIQGIIVDPQDGPIAGVKVKAKTAVTGFNSSFSMPSQSMPIPGEGAFETVSDAEGRFDLEGLPAEEVQLGLESPHRHGFDKNYPVDQEQRIVISGSGRPGILRFKVIDQKTDKRVPEFTVLRRIDPKPRVLRSDNGRFESAEDFTEGDDYWVYIYSKNYAPAVAEIRALAVDSNEEATVKLTPAPPLFGRTLDAQNGKPLAGVKIVYAVAEWGKNRYLLEWSELEHYTDGQYWFVQHAVSDENGNFWFCEAADRTKGTLFILTPGYERLILKPDDRPTASDAQPMSIKLYREATISGVLLKDGKPQAEAPVSVWRQDPRTNLTELFERVPTDSQGKYRIGNLEPGTYGVCYIVPPYRDVFIPVGFSTVTLGRGEQKVLEPTTIKAPASPFPKLLKSLEATKNAGATTAMEGNIAIDKDLSVGISGTAGGEPDILQLKTIHFKKIDERLSVDLKGQIVSWPKGQWRVEVALLDAAGNLLAKDDKPVENSGFISSYPAISPLKMSIAFASKIAISDAKRFRVRLVNAAETTPAQRSDEKNVAPKPASAAIADFVSGIRAAVPKGWECSVINERGKIGSPHGLDEPVFRIDFINPTESFVDNQPHIPNRRSHPSLRLYFYPITAKKQILNTMEAQQYSSRGDIPWYSAETQDYILLTAPEWINGGNFGESRKLLLSLDRALTDYFGRQKQGGSPLSPATILPFLLPLGEPAGREETPSHATPKPGESSLKATVGQ